MLSRTLFDVIRSYLNHKVEGNDEKYISDLMDDMQKDLNTANIEEKTDIVQQVIFLNLIGYDVSWADFTVLEVMATDDYSAKRIAYTAASQMWNSSSDAVLMATNRIQHDLTSIRPLTANAVLTSLPPYLSLPLSQHIAHDVIALMSGARPQLRQKAIMTFYHICLKYPDALRPGFATLRKRLDDSDQSVVFSALTVMSELCQHNPSIFVSMIPKFHKMLETSPSNWISVRLITILRMLSTVEPRLPKKLVGPFTTILETTQSITVLFECVRTIIDIPITNPILLTYATQRMQAFLEHQDANLRFLCLSLFIKLIEIQPKLVAQHKELITQCLDSSDETTRLLALDLLAALANERTIDGIVAKMFDHFRDSKSQNFKDQVLSKVIDICSNNDYDLITDFDWYITCLIDFLEEGGFTIYDKLADQFLDLATRVPVTRQTLVDLMGVFFEKVEYKDKSRLLLVAAHIIGEYSTTQESLESVLQDLVLQTDERVQLCCLSAALKLYLRLPDEEKEGCDEFFDESLEMFSTMGPAEVQDRAQTTITLLSILRTASESEKLEQLKEGLSEELPDELEPIESPPGLNDPIELFIEDKEEIEEPTETISESIKSEKTKSDQPIVKKRRIRHQNQSAKKPVIIKHAKVAPAPPKPKQVEQSAIADALKGLDLSGALAGEEQPEVPRPMPYNQEQLMALQAQRASMKNSRRHGKSRHHKGESQSKLKFTAQKVNPIPQPAPVTGPIANSRGQLIGENSSLIVNAVEFFPDFENPGQLEIQFNVHNQTGIPINAIDLTIQSANGAVKGIDVPSITNPIQPVSPALHKIKLEVSAMTAPQKVKVLFVPVDGGIETLEGTLKIFPSYFLGAAKPEEFEEAQSRCVFNEKLKPITSIKPRDVLQATVNIVRGCLVKTSDSAARGIYAKTSGGHEAIAIVQATAGQTFIEIQSTDKALGTSLIREIAMKLKVNRE